MLTPTTVPPAQAKLPSKPPSVPARTPYSARQFFLDDYGRTLFPLTTNRVLVEAGEDKIRAHFQALLAKEHAFLPQRRVYAAKDALHLRRTVKLDPVAEFFIYDLVYRNRDRLRKSHIQGRSHYGYSRALRKPRLTLTISRRSCWSVGVASYHPAYTTKRRRTRTRTRKTGMYFSASARKN